MDKPKNCTECIHYHDCRAGYYGSYLCQYEKEITAATLEKMKD